MNFEFSTLLRYQLAQPKLASTARSQRAWLSPSSNPGSGLTLASSESSGRTASRLGQSPTLSPAAMAAPRAVTSSPLEWVCTGIPRTFAWCYKRKGSFVMPPSTLSFDNGVTLWAASSTSLVLKQTASKMARTTCARLECWLSPTMTPLASERQ